MPSVSIIVPVYNARTHLTRCVRSILSQDFPDWEAIFVDDGSTDGSADLLRGFSREDSRIRLAAQKNGGPGAARNTGLTLAAGEYLQFLDADDELPPGAIRSLVQAMQGMDLVIGHFELHMGGEITRRGLISRERTLDAGGFLDLVIKRPGAFYYSVLWNKLYRRSIVEKNVLRFDPDVIWGEDCQFNMHYYHFVHAAKCIPTVVYRYHRKMGGLTWASSFRWYKGTKAKARIYRALKQLYRQAGLYETYRWRIHLYLLNVTLLD